MSVRPSSCPQCGYHEFERDSENLAYMLPEGAFFLSDDKMVRTDENGDSSRNLYGCPKCLMTFLSKY